MLKNIQKGNPEIDKPEIKLWICNQETANAYCSGDGNIFVYADLIRKLENESQLAYIICHELAHYHCNHVDKSEIERIRIINSDSLELVLNKISKEDYGQRNKIFNALKQFIYSKNFHVRKDETEADSLGLIFFSKTNYNISEAPKALFLLDSIENEKYRIQGGVVEVFDHPDFKFNLDWITEDKSSLSFFNMIDDEDKLIDKDSIKTHPDCLLRKESIENQIDKLNIAKSFVTLNDKDFKNIVEKMDLEMINSALNIKNYSRAFLSLLCIKFYL
jgi:Zn-dependent protease with chaperone function